MSTSRPPLATLVGRTAATLALALVVAGLSRLPLGSNDPDTAALRFSWRLRGEEAAACRLPTEEELADLPVHMRNPNACIGDLPPFEFRVDLDGVTRVSRSVRPSGARGDRPLFVYDELRTPPGRHRLSVRFGPREDDESATRTLVLDTTVVLQPGRVLLVSRALDGRLEVRTPIR